jgi:hypothetical protein
LALPVITLRVRRFSEILTVDLSDFMLTGGLNLLAPFSLQLTYSQLFDSPFLGMIVPNSLRVDFFRSLITSRVLEGADI